MEHWQLVPFLFAMLLLPAIIAAQPQCLTGADLDCNNEVNITELLDYIDQWYGCSECVPDLFDAIQAYYMIPFCGDLQCNGVETCSDCPADCGGCGPGALYYVSNSGDCDDGWNGNSTNPWCTLDQAFRQATYGDTVLIRDGNYGDFVYTGSSDFPVYEGSMKEPLPGQTQFITFRAAPGHEPVIKRIELGNGNQNSYAPLVFEGFRIEPETGYHGITCYRCVGPRFRNMTITGQSLGTGYGIELGFAGDHSNDIRIEDSVVHTFMRGIHGYGSNIVVQGNDVYNIGSDHIMFGSGGTSGFNILIEDNHVHHTNKVNPDDHPDGIAFLNLKNVTFRNNWVHDMAPAQGIFDHGSALPGSSDVLIENNLIYAIGVTELQFDPTSIPSNWTIRGNTIIGDSIVQQVYLGSGTGHDVYDNIFICSYGAADGVLDYHDHNIYVKKGSGAATGDEEPNSTRFDYVGDWDSTHAAVEPLLFSDPANQDYHPSWSLPGFFDNSGKYSHPCNMSSTGSYVGALPCDGEAPAECAVASDCPDRECGTNKRCEGSSCVYDDESDGLSCTDDGLFCTGQETCQSGQCTSAGDPCGVTQVCNETTDSCDTNPCYGISECSHYDEADCPADPCSIQAECSWNATEQACFEVVHTAPENYVSYWRFEGDADDELGTNNGAENGDPQYTAGAKGQGIELDGAGDFIEMSDSPSLDITGSQLSLSFWMKRSETGTVHYILGKMDDTSGDKGYYTGIDNNGYIYFGVRDGSTGYVRTSGRFTSTAWQHIALTFDSGTCLIYVDGDNQAATSSGGGCSSSAGSTSASLFIGKDRASQTSLFSGVLDEVMFYDRALSAQEIQQVYDAQKIQ